MQFQPPRPRNDDERILPLINIVFLLLIFFMLAGRFSATDPFQITPPQSVSEGPAATQDLVVQMAADGRLAVNGVLLDESALEAQVAQHLAAAENLQVRLKADGGAAAVQVVAVMELLREAGVERLQLLTVGTEP
ncbi:MAG TPA: biopolymer transporter ExbD [Kiloniellaceae bacterium]|nr:biopolymer transporter ExbD [Kiloniellaceae bacterium]HIP77144.1 biopolymer transporter ExbD [Kiloniellaceae bacterium]